MHTPLWRTGARRGHWHPITHCLVHATGPSLSQVGGQAVPHLLNSWPPVHWLFELVSGKRSPPNTCTPPFPSIDTWMTSSLGSRFGGCIGTRISGDCPCLEILSWKKWKGEYNHAYRKQNKEIFKQNQNELRFVAENQHETASAVRFFWLAAWNVRLMTLLPVKSS